MEYSHTNPATEFYNATSPYASLIQVAHDFAEKAHEGQTRWDGETSYFRGHVRPVALLVEAHTRSLSCEVGKALAARAQIVAYLHDTVEDTNTTLDTIADLFGIDAAMSVDAITKRPGDNYAVYIKRVSLNEIATIVKIQDISHNLSSLETQFKGLGKKAQKDKYRVALLYLKEKCTI